MILAGCDTVANAREIRSQLQEWQQALEADGARLPPTKRAPRVQVEFHEGYFHGQIFAFVTEQRRMINDLLAMVAEAEASEAVADASQARQASTQYVAAGMSSTRLPRDSQALGKAHTVECALPMGVMRRVHIGDATRRAARGSTDDDDTDTASVVSSAYSPSEASSCWSRSSSSVSRS